MGVSVWLAQSAVDPFWPTNATNWIGLFMSIITPIGAVLFFVHRQIVGPLKERMEELKKSDFDIRGNFAAEQRTVLEIRTIMERMDRERAEMRGDIGQVRGEVSQLMESIHENERQLRAELGAIREGQAAIQATIAAKLDVVDGLKEVGQEIVREMRETRQNRERQGRQS